MTTNPTSTEAARFSVDFPADTSVLEKISSLVERVCQHAGFGMSEIRDIQLAVDEACTNAICHGLKKDPNRSFQLVLQGKSGEVEIVIREIGVPYIPLTISTPDVAARLDDRPIGQMGIYLIRTLMDEAGFYKGSEGENIFRMVKRKEN